jgi:hypothetical protein
MFLPLMPFFTFLIVNSVYKILKEIHKNKYLSKIVLIFFLYFIITGIPYYLTSSFFNASQEISARNVVEHNTKNYLNGANIKIKTLFFADVLYPISEVDFTYENKDSTNFLFLNANRQSDKIEDVEEEICVKTHKSPRGDGYFYIVRPKILFNGSFEEVQKNFKWLEEEETIFMVKKREIAFSLNRFLQTTVWDYGLITYHFKMMYSNKTLLERFLENKNAEMLYENYYEYYQMPSYMHDLFKVHGPKFPFLYQGKIYKLNLDKLNCNNWYYPERHKNITYKYMSQNATLSIHVQGQGKTKLKITAWSFFKPRTLEIYLKNKIVLVKNVTEKRPETFYTKLLNLAPGENVILLHSKESCDVPDKVGAWENDMRCLSFAFRDITQLTLEDIIEQGVLYESNWYPEEVWKNMTYRFMSQNGTIAIYNPNDTTEHTNLRIILGAVNKSQTLNIYKYDNLIGSHHIDSVWGTTEEIVQNISLKPGDNTFRFESKEGCMIHSEIGGPADDQRCLSFAVVDVKLQQHY